MISPWAAAFRWLMVLATAVRITGGLVAGPTRHRLIPAHDVAPGSCPALVDDGPAASHLVLPRKPERKERAASATAHDPGDEAPNLRGMLREEVAHRGLHNHHCVA